MEQQMNSIDGRLASAEAAVSSIRAQTDSMNGKIITIDKKLTAIEMTIENELSRNIQIIAEGHLDLSRKLNKAIHQTSRCQNFHS